MSPQTRRGRATPASHRKSPARGASTAARKPASSVEELDEEQLDEGESQPVRRETRPIRRQRGLARIRRSSAYKYAEDAVGAYVPLFIVFVIAFVGVWAWISFGPHAPTPKESWNQLEAKWMPKRTADLQTVSNAVKSGELSAEIAGYKAFRDDTKGWMDDLSKVSTWEDPHASVDPNQQVTATSAVGQLIQDGNTEVTDLNQVVAATSSNDIAAMAQQIVNDEQTFMADYDSARVAILGAATGSPSAEPTLAVPSASPGPCESPGASGSPGSSAEPSSCVPASASGSPAPSGSPISSGSPAGSASPNPS